MRGLEDLQRKVRQNTYRVIEGQSNFLSRMKSSASRILSVIALVSLGIRFAACQDNITFTTFYSPFFYDFFPDYNGDGLQPTCSATYYDTSYPVAAITTSPGQGVFLVSITLETATETQVYIYTSDPADSTQTGCLYEYYTAGATAFSFSIFLVENYPQLYTIVLTMSGQDSVSGTFSLDPEPGSTLPATSTTSPSSTPPLTTEAPATSATPSTTPAPTTQAPASTSAAPTSQPPTTRPTTTQAPPTSSPRAPSTTPGATTQILLTTTAVPSSTPAVPSTTPAPPSTTPAIPTTTPALPSSTPAIPSTTPTPTTTTTTTPPPTTGNVKVTLTVDFTPNPPLAGQPLTIFGDAVASSGPAPTGNVTVFVDGVPVATATVVPSGDGGQSLFSVTITAPSTPGAHTIAVVFSSSGGGTPVAAPVTIQVNVVLGAAATVNLVLSSSSLLFPSCLKPLTAIAWVSGANGSTAPTGTVTLGISGGSSASLGANLNSSLLGTEPVVAGAATFDLHFSGPLNSAADALKGSSVSEPDAELAPGSYQLTACYSGDTTYGPACGSAPLTVGPECSHLSLTTFNAHS
ncbi:hypothetical protein COCOBI_03-8330 [Coccomyxa sp. Obi]|nr:hypothetical protein COCOBI_03-8330 [Coccomyxa sp. Obi]